MIRGASITHFIERLTDGDGDLTAHVVETNKHP
jgi:hypothetical protein